MQNSKFVYRLIFDRPRVQKYQAGISDSCLGLTGIGNSILSLLCSEMENVQTKDGQLITQALTVDRQYNVVSSRASESKFR